MALGALDVQWPFVGEAFGGTQVFTPRVQIVATPPIKNLAIPNEDARAIDLEDSNLFALNRFPGYDRVEDGARVTYGLDWSLRIPDWELKTNVGKSYRLDSDRDICPVGTGLSERFSDFVGRTEVRYKNFLRSRTASGWTRTIWRSAATRSTPPSASRRPMPRSAMSGSTATSRGGGFAGSRGTARRRCAWLFANYWSLFGSGVFNLTDREEDPTLASDGFDPIRTRLGIAYQDDCLELGVTWRRDYIDRGRCRARRHLPVLFQPEKSGFPIGRACWHLVVNTLSAPQSSALVKPRPALRVAYSGIRAMPQDRFDT